jgi:hypothetical protein
VAVEINDVEAISASGYFAGGLIGLFVLVIILCDMTSIIRDFRLLRYRINNEH